MDPPEWKKFITLKLVNGKVKVGELPLLIGAISSKTTKPTIKTIKESIPHSENMKRYLKICSIVCLLAPSAGSVQVIGGGGN